MAEPYHLKWTELAARSRLENQGFLLLVGELFQKGYAHGLVHQAKNAGWTIIESTVGRRTPEGHLRPLTQEEICQREHPLINVPLEAGFEWESDSNGQTWHETLKSLSLASWKQWSVDPLSLREWIHKGQARLSENLRQYWHQVAHLIKPKPGQIVWIFHLMAGGVPKNRVMLALLNRMLRSSGEKFLSSQEFFDTPLGQTLLANFHQVTADSFNLLIQEGQEIWQNWQKNGIKVVFGALGYHGTRVWDGHKFRWQQYAPYIQGWAKLALESYAQEWNQKGAVAVVYNVPEVLTQSSAVFQGIELPLFSYIRGFKEYASKVPDSLDKLESQALLEPIEESWLRICELLDEYWNSPWLKFLWDPETWPAHNQEAQMSLLLKIAQSIQEYLKPEHQESWILTVSQHLISQVGHLIFTTLNYPELLSQRPVLALGHDILIDAAQQN